MHFNNTYHYSISLIFKLIHKLAQLVLKWSQKLKMTTYSGTPI